ncbi:flagellar P-ring protein precursor I [alpha proteobacterium BAL199]|nr:flagellar P-ring protein precursor I [alpha proteobacterium BAL199]
MAVIADILARALLAHRVGNIEAASAGYREILAASPLHPRANHLLGFALLQQGSPADAEPLLATALRRTPTSAEAWSHLGLAQFALKRLNRAESSLRRALMIRPSLLDANECLVRITLDKNPRRTIRIARRTVTLAPMRAAGWHSLGLACARRRADAPAPDDAQANIRRSIVIDPTDGSAATDLTDMLRSHRTARSASRIGLWALCLNPGSAAARVAVSAVHLDLDRIDAADRTARSAAVLAPGTANAYGNRAQCHYRLARFDRAIVDGTRAAAAAPEDPQILANLGSYHLAVGNLVDGWRLFGHRKTGRAIARSPHLPGPQWTGELSARLLVLAEQGLGDEILFASCWPDLADAVRRNRLSAVRVEIDPRLRGLAERSFPELEWLDRNRTAGPANGARRSIEFAATHWIAAGDLPTVFRREQDAFPTSAGYLIPDPDRVNEFRRWLDAEAPGQRRMGLCWRSGLTTEDRVKYYPELSDCRPLLHARGLRIVILQYDDCAAEVTALDPAMQTSILFPPDLDRRDDLDGAAALMAALDGVVSAQTAVQALAGAVGAQTLGFDLAPTWVELGQARSPWYPSMTNLHRQSDETWEQLMQRVADHALRSDGPTASGR